MAVGLDSTAKADLTGTPANAFTFSIPLGAAQANRQAIVWIVSLFNGASLPTISGVTVGSDSLSAISGASVTSGTAAKIEGWGGAISNTATGSVTVSISHNRGGQNIYLGATCVVATGTDLVNNGNAGSAGSAPISLAMTSPAGDMSTTAFTDNGSGSPTTTQTLQQNMTGGIEPTGADTKTTISGTDPTHQWSQTGAGPGMLIVAGANFRASGGGTSQTPSVAPVVLTAGDPGRVLGTVVTPSTP